MINLSALLLCILGLSGTLAGSRQEPDELSPLFARLSFDEAVASTKGNKKILVVKATAAWCQPCKLMDSTTWRDEKVFAWFKENGLAIKFDVDKQADLAKRLEIGAMPTMIAFVDGREFDRIVGYKGATEFLGWVDGVKEGKRSIEAVQHAARGTKEEKEEVDSRYDLARSLVQSGELDEATEEFAWVWVNSKNARGYGGVRGSFMAGDMERLAGRHGPARERFTVLRDEAGVKMSGEKVDPEDLDDWVVLNRVVGEPGKTLEWFDRIKSDLRWLPVFRRSFHLERLLEAEERWTDIAAMYPDPVEDLSRLHEVLEMANSVSSPEEGQEEMKALHEGMFREKAGKLHSVMLAAGREVDAKDVLGEAIYLDDSPEMRVELVSRALGVGQARPVHVELLDEAESAGWKDTGLRERLSKALSPAGKE